MVVPTSQLDKAAELLLANGWKPGTSILPNPRLTFPLRGYESLKKACRRVVHPNAEHPTTPELLLFPASYVGLDDTPINSGDLAPLQGYENVYMPSLALLATSFVRTAMNADVSGTEWGLLLACWCKYCHHSAELGNDGLVGFADVETQKWWDTYIGRGSERSHYE